MRDRRVEIEACVFQGFDVELNRDVVGVFNLGNDIPQRRLVELELRDWLVEGRVDFLFLASRISQIDRLVFLAEPRDLLPPLGARVEDRRLIREWNCCCICQMQDVHEAPLLIPPHSGVLGVVVEEAGDERGCRADNPGRHGNWVVGVEGRSLLGDHLRDFPLRLHKRIGGPLVTDADTLLDQRVVSLGELLDLLLAPLQFAVEPLPLASNGRSPLGGQVAVQLLS